MSYLVLRYRFLRSFYVIWNEGMGKIKNIYYYEPCMEILQMMNGSPVCTYNSGNIFINLLAR